MIIIPLPNVLFYLFLIEIILEVKIFTKQIEKGLKCWLIFNC